MIINFYAIKAIFKFEMSRTYRTPLQSFASPVIATVLYFVVFGSAIGNRMTPIDGISYGAFIVPGLIMLTVMTQSVANASFGIYFPKFLGTIYEHLSAPISSFEMVIGYVGAAATKSAGVGCIILAVSFLFVPLKIQHPLLMLAFYPRFVGQRLRAAKSRSGIDHHAFGLSGWEFLFDRYAAIAVANSELI